MSQRVEILLEQIYDVSELPVPGLASIRRAGQELGNCC